jgi:hypothetical protein
MERVVYAYDRSLEVEDASGARFQIHEYRSWWLSKRFVLDTGEEAFRIDKDTFEVMTTGETLVRVRER